MRYAYEDPSGKIHWHEQRMADGPPPAVIEVDGVEAKRCYRAEQKGGASPAGWPLECEASGVLPEQADELRAEFKKHGLKVEVSPRGNPIYTGPQQRREALKARGFFDRSSYV